MECPEGFVRPASRLLGFVDSSDENEESLIKSMKSGTFNFYFRASKNQGVVFFLTSRVRFALATHKNPIGIVAGVIVPLRVGSYGFFIYFEVFIYFVDVSRCLLSLVAWLVMLAPHFDFFFFFLPHI